MKNIGTGGPPSRRTQGAGAGEVGLVPGAVVSLPGPDHMYDRIDQGEVGEGLVEIGRGDGPERGSISSA